MATNTYTALQTISASGASSVSFTSIPSTYTDLRIVAVGIHNGAGSSVNNWRMTYNGDSSSGLYSNTNLYGTGSAAGSSRDSSGNFMYLGLVGQTSNTSQPVTTFDVMNYANTSTYKTVIARGNAASDQVNAGVGLWRSTSAINRVDLFMSGQTVTGTFTLYGIANADIGAYATGGTITYDANYFYHTFAASGTFTPKQSLSCDILQVAGGAGGGGGGGGGGGAGGLLTFTGQSLTATGYSITVGSGGAGAVSGTNTKGGNGSNSQFASLTASVGGGGGGGYNGTANNAASGGSGGGGEGASSGGASNAGGSGTSGQGYAGGSGGGSDGSGGGGGGAGAIGGNGTNGNPGSGAGAGGIGATSALINAIGAATSYGELVSGNYYFAGGGGGGSYLTVGGAGGYGGGAYGGKVTTAAAANGLFASGGGGGGGGAGSPAAGSAGGSGIVVVRYAR